MIYKNNQHKKSVIKTLIIVVIIVVVGVLSYIVWQSSMGKTDASRTEQQIDKPTEKTKKVINNEIKLDKTYTLPKEELQISYPSNWTIQSNYKQFDGYSDNEATLTNKDGKELKISIPSSGPKGQFGERITPCPFDQDFNANSSYYQPSVCPTYKQLYYEPIKKLTDASTYVFQETYPAGSDLKNKIVILAAKNGCKGADRVLCERPDANTGYKYIYTELKVDYDPSADFMKTQIAEEVTSILNSFQYVNTKGSQDIN